MERDEALMAAYARGDRGSFEQLFARWAPRLHAFFERSFQCRADADDLLQATFLRIHRARAAFRPEQPFRSWAFAIAARLRQDELRRRRRMPTADEEALAQAEEAAEQLQTVSLHERTRLVRAALDALPESQRIVLHLHRYEQMTFEEIGAVLGTTGGAVKLRAFRAYERLRERLAPLLDEEHAA